jgi:hypothetical protein
MYIKICYGYEDNIIKICFIISPSSSSQLLPATIRVIRRTGEEEYGYDPKVRIDSKTRQTFNNFKALLNREGYTLSDRNEIDVGLTSLKGTKGEKSAEGLFVALLKKAWELTDKYLKMNKLELPTMSNFSVPSIASDAGRYALEHLAQKAGFPTPCFANCPESEMRIYSYFWRKVKSGEELPLGCKYIGVDAGGSTTVCVSNANGTITNASYRQSPFTNSNIRMVN